MRHRFSQLFRSRIALTILLVFLIVSLGGAAFQFKSSYIPGPVSAMQRYDQPLNGYHSHADFEKDCLHCHAPVRCLSANLCQDCHRQIALERESASGLHGLLPGTDKCHSCHAEHQGRDASLYDVPFTSVNHERLSGFFLSRHESGYDGIPLSCHACHPNADHDATSESCISCHAGHNPVPMAAHIDLYGRTCTGCHDGQDRMIAFDHAQTYPLDGAHLDLDCIDCHPGFTFTESGRGCADCHPDPDLHAADFGLDCRRCHATAAWLPAQLTLHTFPLDHGDQGELACETCHSGAYTAYSCYGCHDHQPQPMHELHAQEGVDRLEPCGSCHPTGLPGEARELEHDA
jgi:hypothetical protein